ARGLGERRLAGLGEHRAVPGQAVDEQQRAAVPPDLVVHAQAVRREEHEASLTQNQAGERRRGDARPWSRAQPARLGAPEPTRAGVRKRVTYVPMDDELRALLDRQKRMAEMAERLTKAPDIETLLQWVAQLEAEAKELEKRAVAWGKKMEAQYPPRKGMHGFVEVVLTPDQRAAIKRETG